MNHDYVEFLLTKNKIFYLSWSICHHQFFQWNTFHFTEILIALFRWDFSERNLAHIYKVIHGEWYFKRLRKKERRIALKIYIYTVMLYRSEVFLDLCRCLFFKKVAVLILIFQMEYAAYCIIFRHRCFGKIFYITFLYLPSVVFERLKIFFNFDQDIASIKILLLRH